MSSQHLRAPVAAVAALVLAGCGASTSSPQAAKQPGAHPSTAATHSVGASGSKHHHASTAPHHLSTASSSKAGGTHSSTSPASSAAPTSTPTVSTRHPHSSGAAQAGPAPIAAGTYTFKQTGSQKIAGFSSAVDPTTTMVVDPAKSDGEQTSHEAAGKQQATDQTLLFDRKGMFLVSEVEHLAIPGHNETITCTFHPGVPYPPWPLKVGDREQAGTSCGDVKVTASGQVTGRRTTKIGGKSLVVYVVKVTLTTSGQINSTSTDTEWFSPALRLTVRDIGTISGKYGPFSFTGSFTRTLTSTTPH
jgi:hypothetical protein